MSRSAAGKYDAVVIGAGHNGLTTAAFLAKGGRKVLVLERSQSIGGLAAGEEFHPGYHSSGLLHDTSRVRSWVVERLALKRHGLEYLDQRPSLLALGRDGPSLLLHPDAQRTAAEIRPFSAQDAEAYLDYRRFIDRVGGFLSRLLDTAPPQVEALGPGGVWGLLKTGLGLRRLGKKEMMELLRASPMCVADWLGEWFETDLLKAALAGWALTGDLAGPWSPGTNINLLLWEAASTGAIKGGPQALVSALGKAARSHGVEIRTESEVCEVLVSAGKVKGVMLAGGERIEAPMVAASCDPRHTFLDLLPSRRLTRRLEQRIQNLRGVGMTAKVNLALDSPLEFACRPGEAIEFARTGDHFDHLEKAFDAAKYRRFSKLPVLDIHLPSLANPQLAPPGGSVVSVLVHFAPYNLEGGWNDGRREELGEMVVAGLAEYAPGLSRKIVARQVLTPADLEERFHLFKGQINHGEQALDQLIFRPIPECARYSTPIAGLYLCGSGSHPGGGITCAPGALAASVMTRG